VRLLRIPSFRACSGRAPKTWCWPSGRARRRCPRVVLVAQDLASWGSIAVRRAAWRVRRDASSHRGSGAALSTRIERVRLPISTRRHSTTRSSMPWCPRACPTSTCRCSTCLVPRAAHAPWGDAETFLERIDTIRAAAPDAALRSSFILGYRERPRTITTSCCRSWRGAPRLAGFFTFSEEPGTSPRDWPTLCPPIWPGAPARMRRAPRRHHREHRAELVGQRLEVLVDEAGVARSHREAPTSTASSMSRPASGGEFHKVVVTGAAGPDLWAET